LGSRHPLPLPERRRVLELDLLVPDAFLGLELAAQEQQEVVDQDQELILHLCRHGSRSPGAPLGQQMLTDVEELLDVPPQAVDLGDEPRREMKLGGEKLVVLAAFGILIAHAPELPRLGEPHPLVGEHPLVDAGTLIPRQAAGLAHHQVLLGAGDHGKAPLELGPPQKREVHRHRIDHQQGTPGVGPPVEVGPGTGLDHHPFMLMPLGLSQHPSAPGPQLAQEDPRERVRHPALPAGQEGRSFVG